MIAANAIDFAGTAHEGDKNEKAHRVVKCGDLLECTKILHDGIILSVIKNCRPDKN
jgi:hypothetical protein